MAAGLVFQKPEKCPWSLRDQIVAFLVKDVVKKLPFPRALVLRAAREENQGTGGVRRCEASFQGTHKLKTIRLKMKKPNEKMKGKRCQAVWGFFSKQ